MDGFEEGVGFEEVVGEETGIELGERPAGGFGGGPCLADGVVHVGSEDDWFGAEGPCGRVVEGWFEDPDIEAGGSGGIVREPVEGEAEGGELLELGP